MPTTDSFPSTTNASHFDNMKTNDGNVARIRDGQTVICSAFGDLSIPAGATIDGIRIDLEGTAGSALHDTDVGHWIYVSNDGGSSWSGPKSVSTEPWVVYGGTDAIESAGGASELWGKSWNPPSAEAIQVKFEYLHSCCSNTQNRYGV